MPLLVGMSAGGGLAYLFDPIRGRARRALVRDQAVHLRKEMGEAVGVAYRDVRNRTVGLAAEARSLAHPGQRGDEALAMRARTAIRATASHPRAIDVRVRDGIATLSGPVLTSEVDRVLERVGRVRGIREVRDSLERHETPGTVPGLQGMPRLERPNRWTPATRAIVTLGCAAAAFPFLARTFARGRLFAMAPTVLAGAIASIALGIARQEAEARRAAEESASETRGDGAVAAEGTATW